MSKTSEHFSDRRDGIFEADWSTPRDLSTSRHDGRRNITEIYQGCRQIFRRPKWQTEIIARQPVYDRRLIQQPYDLPILAMTTRTRGKALWVIAGIHGEEPAGPNALVRAAGTFGYLQRSGIPVVVLPMMNPGGYMRNRRYFDGINSVTDCSHLTLDPEHNFERPQSAKPAHPLCDIIARRVLQLIEEYPPEMVLDLHEDNHVPHVDGHPDDHIAALPYLYVQGRHGAQDPVGREVVRILTNGGMPLRLEGETRFEGERIEGGMVSTPHDGSIENLLVADRIFLDGKIREKHAATTSVVVETPVHRVGLAKRVDAHLAVLQALPKLWEMVPREEIGAGNGSRTRF